MKDQFLKAIKERRIGEFSVSSELLKSGPDELMDLLFSRVLIVRAEISFINDYVEYQAYSPEFEPIEPNYTAPKYIARLKEVDGVTYFDSWMKWDDHKKNFSEFVL